MTVSTTYRAGNSGDTSDLRLQVKLDNPGTPAVNDFVRVVDPKGTDASAYQGYINKGSGFVAIAGFTSKNYQLTASEIPPIGSAWPIYAMAVPANLYSDAVSLSNPVVVPGAPTMGTATAGNATATVPYTDGSNGGSAITSHDLQIYDGSGNLIGTITGVANPAVLTSAQGIMNGASYKFKVRAVNSVGPGPYAAAFSNTVTPTVASRMFAFNRSLNSVSAGTAAFNGSQGQIHAVKLKSAPYAVTAPIFAFPGFWTFNTVSETANSNDIPISGAALEVNGTIVAQLKFNGSLSATVTPATTSNPALLSDADPTITIPANATVRVLTAVNLPIGALLPNNHYAIPGDGYQQSTNTDKSAYLNGTTAVPAAGNGNALYGPAYATALGWDASKAPVILTLGDSRRYGFSDQLSGIALKDGCPGTAAQAFNDSTLSAFFPYGNMAVPGTALADMTDAKFAFRLALLTQLGMPFTTIDCNMAINTGRTLRDSHMKTIAGPWMRAKFPGKKIVWATAFARVVVQDNAKCTTYTGQAIDSGFDPTQWNSDLKAGVYSSWVDAVVDEAPAYSTNTAGKFDVPTTTYTLTQAFASGNTVFLNAAPTIGDMLVLSPGANGNARYVQAVTPVGDGTFNVTVLNNFTTAAWPIGTVVAPTNSDDGIHASHQVQTPTRAGAAIVAAKNAGTYAPL